MKRSQLKHNLHKCAAYTLAEAMVAVLVVGVAGLALYAGFSYGFSVTQATRENLRATQIMLQWMETVRLYTWPQVNSPQYVPTKFTTYYDPTAQATNAGGTVYTAFIERTTPANLPPAYRDKMRQLTITVYWTNYNRTTPLVSMRQMQTYVAQQGMHDYVYSPTNYFGP